SVDLRAAERDCSGRSGADGEREHRRPPSEHAVTALATLSESFRYRGLLRNLLARDLSVRYKNSVLGFVWTLLNPLLLMVVFTIVFQVLIPPPTDIPHFPVFILIGILAWNFCAGSVMACAHSVVGNG